MILYYVPSVAQDDATATARAAALSATIYATPDARLLAFINKAVIVLPAIVVQSGVGPDGSASLVDWAHDDGTMTAQQASDLSSPYAAAEALLVTAATNKAAIATAATNALTANAAYIALGTRTAAQVAAQTLALTKQVNALIRYLLNQTGTISDTQ